MYTVMQSWAEAGNERGLQVMLCIILTSFKVTDICRLPYYANCHSFHASTIALHTTWLIDSTLLYVIYGIQEWMHSGVCENLPVDMICNIFIWHATSEIGFSACRRWFQRRGGRSCQGGVCHSPLPSMFSSAGITMFCTFNFLCLNLTRRFCFRFPFTKLNMIMSLGNC